MVPAQYWWEVNEIPDAEPEKNPVSADEVLARAEEAVDRSRNLRHFLALRRALRALRERGHTEDPPPPATH